jgi:hypothetical protein
MALLVNNFEADLAFLTFTVYLSCVRSVKEHAIIATDHAPATALSDYRCRLEIETLFASV